MPDADVSSIDLHVMMQPDANFAVSPLDSSRFALEKSSADAPRRRGRIDWHTLVHAIPDLVWLKDTQGVYLACNPRFEEFFGACEAQIVGKTDYDFVPRELADFFRANDLRAQEADTPCINEEWVRFASDGHRELLETVKTPMRDCAGAVVGVLGVARDITQRKAAEDAVRNLHADLTATLQAIPDQLFEMDGNGTYLQVWAHTPGLLARQKEVLQGRTVFEVHGADAAAIVIAALHEADAKGFSYGKRVRLERHGRTRWLELSVARKASANRDEPRFVVVSHDVTEHRRLADELVLASLSTEISANAVVWIAEDGSIIRANPAACRALDYSPEEVAALRIHDISPELDRDEWKLRWQAVKHAGARQVTVRCRRRDGCCFSVAVTSTFVAVGEHEYIYAVLYDLTEQLELQRTLREAKEAAESASRATSEFLANMSHEIRTPMNAIRGFAQLMLDTRDLPEEQANHLRKIDMSARILADIINGILDYSKIEAGHMELEQIPFSPSDTLCQVCDLLQPAADAKSLDLLYDVGPDVPPQVIGDPVRYREVIANLGSNAVKFTNAGGVHIGIQAQPCDAGGVVLQCTVSDTGMGLAPAQMERLFQPFTQGDMSTTRRHGGTGLGLVISRNLARMMEGDITVSSMPGAGSTFVFTARLGIAVATAIPPRLQGEQPHVQNSLAGTSILLVEDNPINQEVAASFLQRAGAVVKLANDGAEAVALAAVHRFDAILMDLQMPVMDGFEATRRIRALVDGESIPIIGVTASAMIQDKHACLAAGMNDHIAKPIERNALIGSLLRCLHPDGAGNDDMAPGTAVDDDAAPDAAHAELKSLLAGVDVDSALRRLEGRVDLYRRLALSFIQRHGNQAPPPAASRDAVYRLAHDLKGEAGTLGLTALQGRSEELVAAVKAGCDDAEPFVAPLREALAQALRLLAPLTTQTIPSDTARRSNNEGT